MPSPKADEWSYNAYDGKKRYSPKIGNSSILRYSKSYDDDDIVGCGWIRADGKMFFTKNGVNQGDQHILFSKSR